MKSSRLGTLALAWALAACSDSTSPTAGSRATLSFINANFLSADIYVNSVQKIHGLAGGTGASLYLPASSVPLSVVVKWTNDPRRILVSAQVTLAVDTQYTAVLTERSGVDGLIVLPDTVSAPPLGDAKVRLVDVAPNEAKDMYLTTGSADLTGLTPVASNVSFETSSPYVSSMAGPIRIIVTVAGNPGLVWYDSGTQTLSAGQAWTILLMYPGNGDQTPMKGLWIKDRS